MVINERKQGVIRIDAAASESTFPFSLPYVVTDETVSIDSVLVPLHTLSVAVDESNADYRPLIRTASFTIKELQAPMVFFKHLHASHRAVPIRQALMILDKYAAYAGTSRTAHYARQLANRLSSSDFLKRIINTIEQTSAGNIHKAIGCISENITFRGCSFKPVTTPSWEKPFKVSEKYKNNPIQPKPYVESCAPLPPVITRPESTAKSTAQSGSKSKRVRKTTQRPFDNIILPGSADKSVEARQRGERRAQRYRKVLNRTKAA